MPQPQRLHRIAGLPGILYLERPGQNRCKSLHRLRGLRPDLSGKCHPPGEDNRRCAGTLIWFIVLIELIGFIELIGPDEIRFADTAYIS
jgi:hypothetical protein